MHKESTKILDQLRCWRRLRIKQPVLFNCLIRLIVCVFALSPMYALGQTIIAPGESIQVALERGDETIIVLAGVYVEDLEIESSTNLVSASGPAETTIIGIAKTLDSSFPPGIPSIIISANDVRISGFTIQTPPVGQFEYASGIFLTGANIEIDNNVFRVATGGAFSPAIQTWIVPPGWEPPADISGLSIHNNTFTNSNLPPPVGGSNLYKAIYINDQSDVIDTSNPVVIENNTFMGQLVEAVAIDRPHVIVRNNVLSTSLGALGSYPRGIQVSAHSADVLGNIISDFEQGIRVSVDLSSNSDAIINNNSISGNNSGVAFVGTPNGFTVDAKFNWWGNSSGPSGCATCTGSGDTVNEDVTFSPWLTAPPDSCPDADADEICDDQDICPGGDDTVDTDGDFVPDFCDPCTNDPNNDADGDGVCGDVDVCPGGDDTVDTDFDGLPDACDVCPSDPSNDADGDGVCADIDNCPLDANSNQLDTDGDLIGDVCDPDDDGDGICDGATAGFGCTAGPDNCPLIFNPAQSDIDNDGFGDVCDDDSDNDGIIDALDSCPFTLTGEAVNYDGCSVSDLCPCEGAWKNHGAYVKCVARTSEDFLAAGLITVVQKDTIVSTAAQSICGKKK